LIASLTLQLAVTLQSVSLLTGILSCTSATNLLGSVLEPKDFEQWERGDVKDAAALMKPADDELLQKWPVPKRVNSSKAPDDDPTLIDRADSAVDQAALVATMEAVGRR